MSKIKQHFFQTTVNSRSCTYANHFEFSEISSSKHRFKPIRTIFLWTTQAYSSIQIQTVLEVFQIMKV